MSAVDLVTLATCDLGAIVRGRAVAAAELGRHLTAGVSWVPANQSLTPLGPLADHTPFGSVGDLRLLPDTAAHVKVEGDEGNSALELILCDITETDGTPWAACPRRFMRDAVEQLSSELSVSVGRISSCRSRSASSSGARWGAARSRAACGSRRAMRSRHATRRPPHCSR